MPLNIIRQDITKIKCDAIVAPTNEAMIPGGGVDLAIRMAAGERLDEACKAQGVCPVGEACVTKAFDLPCKYVIHTAGPVWQGGERGETELLASCYKSCLDIALEQKCNSIAFPLISSGRYGFPKDKVMRIAVNAISEYLFEYELTVYLVVFDKESYGISQKLFNEVTAFIDDNYIQDYPKALFNQFPCSTTAVQGGGFVPLIKSKRKKEADDFVLGGTVEEKSCSVEDISESLDLEEMLKSMDKGFADTLFEYIDQRGLTDVECYKRSNVDKKTFSKIKCNKDYRPGKITAVSFAIGLRLNKDETERLLRTVGMSLSKSNKFDVIIDYFITTGNYKDVFDVNEVLYKFDQSTLGV